MSDDPNQPFVIKLKPGANGDFDFDIREAPGPDLRVGPPAPLVVEPGSGIPPQLYQAVNELLGFVYGLDNQYGQRGTQLPANQAPSKPTRGGTRPLKGG